MAVAINVARKRHRAEIAQRLSRPGGVDERNALKLRKGCGDGGGKEGKRGGETRNVLKLRNGCGDQGERTKNNGRPFFNVGKHFSILEVPFQQ